MKRAEFAGILNKARLRFPDNEALERYYEEKYRNGGYEAGCVRFGIDISGWYHRERQRSALRLLEPGPQERILDAGCGQGDLAAEIGGRCAQVHAVDIAGNSLNPWHRTVPNLRFEKMNVERLEYPDATFDKVVSVETLEHVLHPLAAIREFHRVLRPGGRVVITYPTINRSALQRLQQGLGITRPLEVSEHLTEWSYSELVERFASAGFGLLRSEGIVFDFGIAGALKAVSAGMTRRLTAWSLKIRRFPRNSLFVSVAFRKK
jgi:2-polyprenyl-3-methyl-5-hydroxy-6-metoxy-1,4-benzoquinol methylase